MNHNDEVDHDEIRAVQAMIDDEQQAELAGERDEGSRAHHKRRLAGEAGEEWVTGQLPDRSGMFDYVVIIRAPGDPERLPRDARPRDMGAEWRRSLMKRPAGEIADALRSHFADGQARTMNRAGVEMLDKTADVLGGTTFEDALWLLVGAGELEFTMQAPVLFRKVRAAAPSAPDAPVVEPAAPAVPPKAKRQRKPKATEPPKAPARKLSLGRLRTR